MENQAYRARSAGSRGRGRYQSENPHQNRNPWQNSPQNRQYRETGGPQSGAPRAANPYREVGAGQSAQPRSDSSQNWRQDRPSGEAGAAQWRPPRAAGHVENFGQGRSFLDAAVPQSSGSGGNGGDDRRGGGGGGRGRGGRGGAQYVPRQSSMEPAAAATTSAYELEKLKISDPPSRLGSIVPIKRPDKGGQAGIRSLQILVNHFPVNFDPRMKIYQYNLDIQRVTPHKPSAATAKISKADAHLVKEYLFAKFPTLFPTLNTAYDGERNIYSAVELQQCGKFPVDVAKGDDVKPREFVVAVKLVAVHDLNTLSEYFNRTVTCVPREILQALDVVMRENPSLSRIPFGRYFYSKGIDRDLGGGIIASTGFHQSLKPTARGLSICMDYTVISFRKQVPVLEFLREHLGVVIDANMSWTPNQRKEVEEVLKGLKVTVNHRKTSQKYEVVGLTRDNTNNVKFEINSGTDSKGVLFIVDYFRDKYGKAVVYKRIPCLDLSKNKRVNYVPMEFCELVEGQRYPKESLHGDVAKVLKDMALIKPVMRKDWICRMIRASDGPSGGGIADQFRIAIVNNMTEVTGRVLKQPDLKIRNSNDQCCRYTPGEDGQWNLLKHKVYEGKIVDRWAILDFTTSSNRWYQLNVQQFNQNIVERANRVGIRMNPQFLFYEPSSFRMLENERQLYNTLKRICGRAEGKPQLLFCPMEKRHTGYNTLKRICETELGIVTQCFLTPLANQGKDQYYVNLALKINTKLGGSNMELFHSLPCLDDNRPVMFMGADVNHPSSRSPSAISIAAVTASMNWPGANQYAFRIRAQPRRTEKILDIGDMCLDLIKTYARKNGIKPEKIIFFRDGVSDSQFDMVLNEELIAIKKAIEMDGYQPTITLVVAQKRHQTRFFPKNPRDAGKTGNIPPGTVVDNTVIHLDEYDFYLCSHNGILGTSKPTHYHVLFDEHQFSSDDLQRIIYNLCYTFPRCTKPISLVPPVLCADLAAYRGRQYDDSTMHSPHSSASSSSGSSSTSSSMASIEINNFPKVHADLQNQMIFL
ncbi:protein argonaute 2-like isoform X2 [Magnolia sinica]|uniref:protein argonaute 2-like isoform X2 n=1 Tax=Magnolia sinica TaxID=86752 RepID=UPI0026590A65|nr:protein argonaute 2-like isoform X2 [Magnolia sinica]